MKITAIAVENFRLLADVEIGLEPGTTLIVGRNNSGKTSLTELARRLLEESSLQFRFEDFSLGAHEKFLEALRQYRAEHCEQVIRETLPAIGIRLTIEYGNEEDLGALSSFIVDLDEHCTTAKVVVRYELGAGRIKEFFAELDENRAEFFKALRERVPKYFTGSIRAEDPNDSSNTKDLDSTHLRDVLQFGYINAQRTLDEVSKKENAVLGRVFERLFLSSASAGPQSTEREQAAKLERAVEDIQKGIDTNFNRQLDALAPAFEHFGYPGLSDPQLRTETSLDVKQLLSNHTTVSYQGPVPDGINLPESYNGLGSRNLIFILLKIYEFFRGFVTRETDAGIHLIFIEEPEAHLHPQMQAVFIRKLNDIRKLFEDEYNDGKSWPVQFIVTTHSSHIANEAHFDSMRYFLATLTAADSAIMATQCRDLRNGLKNAPSRDFLHQYMTLTRCDLLFADAAILVEGTTERILMPKMICKFDEENGTSLGALYLSIMEVGGAYAHLFYPLVDFLGLRTLVITDIDSVNKSENSKKCKVSEGTHSSNAAINQWFCPDGGDHPTLEDIKAKSIAEKTKLKRFLTYQSPETIDDACGRSFEDAFMLANAELCQITGQSSADREAESWDKAKSVKKTDFALKYAIDQTQWVIPKYITHGLCWLSGKNPTRPETGETSEGGLPSA